MKQTPLQRKPPRYLSRELRALERRLKSRWAAYARTRPCVVCGAAHLASPRGTQVLIEGHHVVEKQELKSAAREFKLDDEATLRLVWDLRNNLSLCRFHHAQHTHWRRRLTRREVLAAAPKAQQFSFEIGRGWYIHRNYPEVSA